MEIVTVTLDLLGRVAVSAEQAKFSRRRCAALSSRCTMFQSILESNAQSHMDSQLFETLNKHLTRADSIVYTLSNRNVLTFMIRSCVDELDEVVAGLDSTVSKLNLPIGADTRSALRRLELKYRSEKVVNDKELQVSVAENNKRLDDIRDLLSLEDIHPFLQQIMEIITGSGPRDTSRISNIVKRIERTEDDDPRLSHVQDVIREGRQNGQDDSMVVDDIVHIVSEMIQAKNSLEQPDPRIDPKDLVIGKVIGSGAFGTICEGTWKSKTVALKVLNDLSAGGGKIFEREVRAINNLKDCSNIISLFGYCLYKNSHIIVMELAENGSLFDFIHSNSSYYGLDDEQKHRIIVGISHGVAIMHQVGIVHRDLKSPNVLLDSRMTPKITDFGLAGMGTKSLLSTLSKSTAMSIGSVYWKAPEILMGKKHTNKSDIFALGIIIWEVLQGEIPFNGEEHAIVSKLITDGKKMQVTSGMDAIYKRTVSECQNISSDTRPTALEVLQWLKGSPSSDKEYIETELLPANLHSEPQKQREIPKEIIQESQPAAKVSVWKIVLALLVGLVFLVKLVFLILVCVLFNFASQNNLDYGPYDPVASIITGITLLNWAGVAILSFGACHRKTKSLACRILAIIEVDAPRLIDQSLRTPWVLRLANIIIVDLFQLLFCSFAIGLSPSYYDQQAISLVRCVQQQNVCSAHFIFLLALAIGNFVAVIINSYNLWDDLDAPNRHFN